MKKKTMMHATYEEHCAALGSCDVCHRSLSGWGKHVDRRDSDGLLAGFCDPCHRRRAFRVVLGSRRTGERPALQMPMPAA